MSRLDSVIGRLMAQRDILDLVAEELDGIDGPVIELGLGNGRTYDHLREKLPGRRIVAFDRMLAAHKDSTPEGENLVLGEIAETARAFVGLGAALVHADIGTGYDDRDALTLTWLPQLVASVLRPEGLAVSGLPLDHAGLTPLSPPASVRPGRYHLYRRRG